MRDKMMLKWHFKDDLLELKDFVQNPAGYPAFQF
jgi:hypothetical protein